MPSTGMAVAREFEIESLSPPSGDGLRYALKTDLKTCLVLILDTQCE